MSAVQLWNRRRLAATLARRSLPSCTPSPPPSFVPSSVSTSRTSGRSVSSTDEVFSSWSASCSSPWSPSSSMSFCTQTTPEPVATFNSTPSDCRASSSANDLMSPFRSPLFAVLSFFLLVSYLFLGPRHCQLCTYKQVFSEGEAVAEGRDPREVRRESTSPFCYPSPTSILFSSLQTRPMNE